MFEDLRFIVANTLQFTCIFDRPGFSVKVAQNVTIGGSFFKMAMKINYINGARDLRYDLVPLYPHVPSLALMGEA